MSTAVPPKIIGRTMRLPSKQRDIFDRIFRSGGGDVLDFSIRTMTEWFSENHGIEIFQPRFQADGASKGKTLRGFVAMADPRLVARVLRSLWAYRCTLPDYVEKDPAEEARLFAWYEQFTAELDQASPLSGAYATSSLIYTEADLVTSSLAVTVDVRLIPEADSRRTSEDWCLRALVDVRSRRASGRVRCRSGSRF